MSQRHAEGSAHLFRCAMRYFKVSLCDGGSRARDSRKASSFFSGSVSSERTEREEQSPHQDQTDQLEPRCCSGLHVLCFPRASGGVSVLIK